VKFHKFKGFAFAIAIFAVLGSFKAFAVEPANIRIFMCADDGNVLPTCVTMASILDNSTENERMHFHIVGNNMSQKNLDKISAIKMVYRDFDFEMVPFDMKKLDEFDTQKWNKSIMIKLYGAEIFPNLDKILWLDSDILVNENVRELWEKDLTGKYIAAVDVHAVYNYWFKNNNKYWITAGIGLYNLNEIRKNNLQDEFINNARVYTQNYKTYDDLCGGVEEWALTKAIKPDKCVLLPYRYGIMAYFSKNNNRQYLTNFDNEIKNCKIMHLTSDSKPWVRLYNDHIVYSFQQKWWRYAKKIGILDDIVEKYINPMKPARKRTFMNMIEKL
jgi:lipopolysaccharide biosynthesis glycosyltransferase